MSQAQGNADPNVVGIIIGTQSLSGWEDVRVSCGIEQFPRSFEIALTEKYPTQPTDISIQPGAPCQITIGGTVMVTGYVDRYSVTTSGEEHEIRVAGRGMCEDLVDCSARFASFQINNSTLVSTAQKLCQPFGITVKSPDGDSAPEPQFNITLQETPYEVIERISHWANFLVYENADGSLNIARVGDANAASGFVEGKNVQASSVTFSMDERYTEMYGVYLSTAFLLSPPPGAGAGGPVIPYVGPAFAVDSSWPARADGQPRYRPLIVLSEQTQNSDAIAANYVQWDMARRIGRSQRAVITCDNWRDKAGTLWTPNTLAPLNLPTSKLTNQTWLISHVDFIRRARTGTTAEITLMPPAAFVPEAENLVQYNWAAMQALPGGATNIPTPALR